MVYLSNFVKLNSSANMKYFIGLSLLLLSNFTSGQKIFRSFDELIFQEDFSSNVKEWPIKNTSSELFHILDESYEMERVSEDYFSIVFAKEFKEFNNFELEARLKIKRVKANRDASGGMVFRAQESGEDAMIIEINNKREYRLQLIRQGTLMPFFKDDQDGWVKSTDISPYKYNTLTIKADGSAIDLYINGEFQRSFLEPHFKPGAIGLYLDANSKMSVDNLKVSVSSRANFVKQNRAEEKKEVIDETGYEEILLVFRKKISTQQSRIEELESDLAICQSNFTMDTTLRGKNKILSSENKDLNKRVVRLEDDLYKAKNRLEYLESMKADIESDPNGDLILNLTELLATEKKKNLELRKEIEELKKQL